MDEVVLDGKTYIASRKAASDCGYTQDYVGQLCRGGHIDARRVSGHWYIFPESLKEYKAKADLFKPEPPKYAPDPNAESSLTIEGKEYVSAGRAAKLASYAQDYIGQLARAGKIPSKQIGNRWYVEKEALLAHKSEKDSLLAAVQAESVGLKKPVLSQIESATQSQVFTKPAQMTMGAVPVMPLLTYAQEPTRDLLPVLLKTEETATNNEVLASAPQSEEGVTPLPEAQNEREVVGDERQTSIAINVIRSKPREEIAPARNMRTRQDMVIYEEKRSIPIARKAIFPAILWKSTATVVALAFIGLGVAYVAPGGTVPPGQTAQIMAAAANSTQGIGDYILDLFGHQLVYSRGQ